MSYTKPTLVPLGNAVTTIQGQSKGDCHNDSTRPATVNAYEAESRRLARFVPFGHTPGVKPEPRSLTRPELPHTLDLRWSH